MEPALSLAARRRGTISALLPKRKHKLTGGFCFRVWTTVLDSSPELGIHLPYIKDVELTNALRYLDRLAKVRYASVSLCTIYGKSANKTGKQV
jgi:hypothetical protein